MRVTAVIPPKGRLVFCAWAAIPCAVLAPFFYWRGLANGLFFTLAALILVFSAYARTVSFVAAADGALLRLFSGVVFPTVRRIPQKSVCGVARISTPLLTLAGCRILVLYMPGGAVRIFGLAEADALALCAWARAGADQAGPPGKAPDAPHGGEAQP
ncbi:MAG: hypothetical protein LKJ90_04215 [Faecalibacterium sp.]|nr:hypothetical protein [Faecalibacterium sp.]